MCIVTCQYSHNVTGSVFKFTNLNRALNLLGNKRIEWTQVLDSATELGWGRNESRDVKRTEMLKACRNADKSGLGNLSSVDLVCALSVANIKLTNEHRWAALEEEITSSTAMIKYEGI